MRISDWSSDVCSSDLIADATWKWAPQGNFKDGGVTLRSEVFLEDRKGWLTDPLQPDDTLAQRWNGQRWGAYVQGVYRNNRQWETGYRYDYLRADRGLPLESGFERLDEGREGEECVRTGRS